MTEFNIDTDEHADGDPGSSPQTSLRSVVAVLVIGTIAVLGFCVALYLSFGGVTVTTAPLVTSDVPNARFDLEPPTQVRGHLEIRGWVLLEGEIFAEWDNRIVLRNNVTGQVLELPTMMVMRPDVTEAMEVGPLLPGQVPSDQFGVYDPSGFAARVPLNMLTSPREAYSILIDIRSDQRDLLIDTNRSLG